MKIFKISISTLLFVLFLQPILAISCYDAWLNSFETATAIYEGDLDRCNNASIPFSQQLCLQEAELNYSSSLNLASDEFEICVGG